MTVGSIQAHQESEPKFTTNTAVVMAIYEPP